MVIVIMYVVICIVYLCVCVYVDVHAFTLYAHVLLCRHHDVMYACALSTWLNERLVL